MPDHGNAQRTTGPRSAVRESAAGLNRLQLTACCLGVFLAVLNQTLVATALTSIQHEFGATHAAASWVVDAYTLTLAGLMLTSGSLCDRFGPRRIQLVGLVLFSAGALGCALSTGMNVLIVMRVFQAAGASMVTPATLAVVTTAYRDPAQRARAVGFWSGAVGLGVAMGPVIGGLTVEAFGWPSVFWLTGVCAIAALGPALSLPASRPREKRRSDVAGQLAVFGFLVALTYAVINGAEHGWLSGRNIALYLLASLLTGALVLIERRAQQPVVDAVLFRERVFVGAAASIFLVYAAMMAFVVYTAVYLQQVRNMSAAETGLALLPSTVPSVLLAPRVGRIATRFGTRAVACLSCALITCALGVMAWGGALHLVWLCGAYLVLGTGFALFTAPLTATALGCAPRDRGGVASATLSAVRQVGNTLGVAVVGAVVQSRLSSTAGSPAAGVAAGVRDGYLLAAASTLVAGLTAAVILRGRGDER